MGASANFSQEDLARIQHHYAQLLREHGDTARAAAWRDRQSQERRMAILAQVGDLRSAKILDFGCGTGHLLAFLRSEVDFRGEYVGYDLSPDLVARARRKFRGARFERRNILSEGVPEDFDYVLISGVFNQRLGDNWRPMRGILRQLFAHCRKALAFNALSTYVDFFDPRLFYVSPERVFRYCKQKLSPRVCLRHDYLVKDGVLPFEFAVYVYRSELEPGNALREEGSARKRVLSRPPRQLPSRARERPSGSRGPRR
jgi:SAM-dependent methyltransferase